MLTQHLIDKYSPSALVFTGLAGGLNPKLEVGDIVLGTDCVQHDMDARAMGIPRGQIPYTEIRFLKSDQTLLDCAKTFVSDDISIHRGRILTGDQFISRSNDGLYDYMLTELKGDAVDMEGASVAVVATLNQIPFLLVRTISDKADDESLQNFTNFLPLASKRSAELICHVLRNYKKPNEDK
jgi:5'-methylthioadenosine/S-adenosylhomocysteine nucleosidase